MDGRHSQEATMPARLQPDGETTILRLVVTLDWLHRLDEWRRLQPDIPNRSEAVRRLVDRGTTTAKRR
jgi:hypothetical protein